MHKRDHISPTPAELHWLPAHWQQNSSVRLQSAEWAGPCLSAWHRHTIQSGKNWGPLVIITLIIHVHPLKPTAIERSCRRQKDSWVNYKKTLEVPNLLSFQVFKINLKTHLYLQVFYRLTHMSPFGAFLVLILGWLAVRFAQLLEQFLLETLRYISLHTTSPSV